MTDPIREAARNLAETVLRSVRPSTVTHEDCGCLTCQAASLLGTLAAQDSLAALLRAPMERETLRGIIREVIRAETHCTDIKGYGGTNLSERMADAILAAMHKEAHNGR